MRDVDYTEQQKLDDCFENCGGINGVWHYC